MLDELLSWSDGIWALVFLLLLVTGSITFTLIARRRDQRRAAREQVVRRMSELIY